MSTTVRDADNDEQQQTHSEPNLDDPTTVRTEDDATSSDYISQKTSLDSADNRHADHLSSQTQHPQANDSSQSSTEAVNHDEVKTFNQQKTLRSGLYTKNYYSDYNGY